MVWDKLKCTEMPGFCEHGSDIKVSYQKQEISYTSCMYIKLFDRTSK
jgi:acetoacetate decarboxylase